MGWRQSTQGGGAARSARSSWRLGLACCCVFRSHWHCSTVGQYVSGGGQRREARAAVLHALELCEGARWAPRGKDEPAHPDALRSLQTAALIARLPRSATDAYVALSRAGWWSSMESLDESGDPEYGGGIANDPNEAFRAAAAVVVELSWKPWRGRLVLRRRLKAVNARAAAVTDQPGRRHLDRALGQQQAWTICQSIEHECPRRLVCSDRRDPAASSRKSAASHEAWRLPGACEGER